MLDGLQLGAPGIACRGDIEVGTFLAAHTDGVILATLTAADSSESLPFNQPAAAMGGGEYRLADYLPPFERVVVIKKFYPGDDVIGAWFIESGAGAFYKYGIGRCIFIDK